MTYNYNLKETCDDHSTETVHIKVLNDTNFNKDLGKTYIWVLLDLRAAFDTVNNNKLQHGP